MSPKFFALPLLLATAIAARADVVLFEDAFENGNLDQWTSKPGDTHSGVIVTDPLNPTNRVLTFAAVKFGGDTFSVAPIPVSAQEKFVLSFDFLGLNSGVENGAFLGTVPSPGADPSTFFWLASTYPSEINAPASAATPLTADGTWRHYEIDLTDVIAAGGWTNLHLALEDWAGLGSVPGDALFDNIRLVKVESGGFDLSIFEQLVPCAGPAPGKKWKNHGHYVSTMSKTVNQFLAAGIITEAEADIVMEAAAKSNCGKPVTKAKAKPARR
jgi:hypothetical protein